MDRNEKQSIGGQGRASFTSHMRRVFTKTPKKAIGAVNKAFFIGQAAAGNLYSLLLFALALGNRICFCRRCCFVSLFVLPNIVFELGTHL